MKEEDLQFLEEILDKSRWLFYGDFEEPLNTFLKDIFKHEFSDYGFEKIPMESVFATAYWAILNELIALDLAEYGTSPRGAWLTEKGKRFKDLIVTNENAIAEVENFIYKKFNP